jgi:hypothetical protein
MSTLKVNNLQDINGANNSTPEQVAQGRAKAWVNFDGTFATSPYTEGNGGIRNAFNVSSVTDNGTGDYTINFSSSLSNANYCPVISTLAEGTAGCQRTTVIRGTAAGGPTTMTANACRINVGSTSSNVFGDNRDVFFGVLGD